MTFHLKMQFIACNVKNHEIFFMARASKGREGAKIIKVGEEDDNLLAVFLAKCESTTDVITPAAKLQSLDSRPQKQREHNH